MPQRYLLDYVHSSHRSTEDTLRPSKTQQTDGHMNSESLKQRAQGMHRFYLMTVLKEAPIPNPEAVSNL